MRLTVENTFNAIRIYLCSFIWLGLELSCVDYTAELPEGKYRRFDTPATEDFTFDREGNWTAVTLNSRWVAMTHAGQQTVLGSSVGAGELVTGGSNFTRGSRFLPNGDLVVAEPSVNRIFRLRPDGSEAVVATDLTAPNGIAIDLDGQIYVTLMSGEVRRIDPNCGSFEVLVTAPQRFDGIAFSPDYKMLYLGDEDDGSIFELPLLPDGTAGPLTKIGEVQTGSPDGMVTDVLGNLYVAVNSGQIVRFTPEHQMDIIVDFETPNNTYAVAINFGSGLGGWSNESLYVSFLDGGMYEYPLGIRGTLITGMESGQ